MACQADQLKTSESILLPHGSGREAGMFPTGRPALKPVDLPASLPTGRTVLQPSTCPHRTAEQPAHHHPPYTWQPPRHRTRAHTPTHLVPPGAHIPLVPRTSFRQARQPLYLALVRQLAADEQVSKTLPRQGLGIAHLRGCSFHHHQFTTLCY